MRNIQTIAKPNGKTGQGGLVIKRSNIAGDANLIIDVALIHEFGGNHMADFSFKEALRHAQPDKLFESTVLKRLRRYSEAYTSRPGVTFALLPCVVGTSCPMHDEFLRFLYILVHQCTVCWFEMLGGPKGPQRRSLQVPLRSVLLALAPSQRIGQRG